jgi:translation initiation factor 1 (eIF-1/SUI1)
MQNFTYDSVMNMPTNERRFYLARHHKRMSEQEEKIKTNKQNSGKGRRTTTISGAQLKNKLSNGQIPLE